MNRIYGIGDEEELANDLQEEMKRMIPIEVLDKIRDEIERKAHSGQWSDATMYGMLKAVAIIDKYRKEQE